MKIEGSRTLVSSKISDVFIYINADLCASLSCCEFISASASAAAIAFSLITSWKPAREDRQGAGAAFGDHSIS